jgi:hypothetical protein
MKKKNDTHTQVSESNNVNNANSIQELYQYSEFSSPHNNDNEKQFTEDNFGHIDTINQVNPITYDKMNINSYKNLCNNQMNNENPNFYFSNNVDVNINLNYNEEEEGLNNENSFNYSK